MKKATKKLIGFVHAFLKCAHKPWVTRGYLIVLVLCIGYCLYQYRDKFNERPEIIRYGVILLSILMSFVNYLFYVYIHYHSYRKLGVNITYRQAFNVLSISRLGTYVPGKIWCATNYYLFSRWYGIDRATIGKNFIINNALLLFTGALMSMLFITKISDYNPHAGKLLLILPVLLLILIHPKVLNRFFSFIIPLLPASDDGREDVIEKAKAFDWNYQTFLFFIFLYFILWSLGGMTLFICMKSFSDPAVSDIPLVLATGAVSLIAALLAVFAPAGVGVREGVGVAMIASIVSVKTAIFAFVLLRLIQVIVDLSVGGISTIGFMKLKRANK
jgi:uncharacterized membrane protein YbhN (UPF0104 family)